MSKKLNVAVIALKMGQHHAEAVAASNSNLYAICDINVELLNKIGDQLNVPAEARYTDYKKLVNDPALDAVIIATPDQLHRPMCEEFLAAGKMERAEAERILPFATAASPAFLAGAVGGMFGGNMGAVLLAGQTVSALALLFLTRKKSFASAAVPAPHTRVSVLSALASAIKESGLASLAVCSFITFFSVFSAMVNDVFSLSGMSAALVSGALEISGGFARLSLLGKNYFACGLILGFGGFSVFMQTADALGDTGVRMSRYFVCKCAQAAVCGVLCAVFGKIFGAQASSPVLFLFGAEQGKIEAIFQIALAFAVIFAFAMLVWAVILKIFGFFSKK